MVFMKESFKKVNFEKISRKGKACKITHHANSQHIHSLVQIGKNFSVNYKYFLIYPFLTFVLGVQKNRLIETVLLSTHTICEGLDGV